MLFAVLLAVAAAGCTNVGKALQKKALSGLPRLKLDREVLSQYGASRAFLAGVAADAFGGILMLFAVSLAPVSLVQPVAGSGLAVLALFSHFYLREALTAAEWGGVALAGLGTAGVGATAAEGAGAAPPAVSVTAVLLFGAAAAGFVATCTALRRYLRRRRRRLTAPGLGLAGTPADGRSRLEELVAGWQAGALFGLSAVAARTGFLLGSRDSGKGGGAIGYAVVGLASSIGLTSTGLIFQTKALKDGNSVVVCTSAGVACIVTAFAFGVLALGEGLPASAGMRAVHLLSFCTILGGVSLLSTGGGKGAIAPTKVPPRYTQHHFLAGGYSTALGL